MTNAELEARAVEEVAEALEDYSMRNFDNVYGHGKDMAAKAIAAYKRVMGEATTDRVNVVPIDWDAHTEFWRAEYKSLARAGVERMAELGYQVDPAEKMIEAAEYREKKILGSSRKPKTETHPPKPVGGAQ